MKIKRIKKSKPKKENTLKRNVDEQLEINDENILVRQNDKKQSEPKNVLPKPGPQKKKLKKDKTAYSSKFINPDGTFGVEVGTKPINYKNKRGYWKTIDNNLIPIDENGYKYENKANSFKVKFADDNQLNPLIKIDLDEKHWLTLSPIEKFIEKPKVDKTSILYKKIEKGIDLKYIVDSNRLKEEIIFNKYPNTNKFTFESTSQGIKFEKDRKGTISAKDKDTDKILFYFQKTFAEDKNGDITNDIDLNIMRENEIDKLTVTINDEWLSNAQYPVIIDPTINMPQDETYIQDTYVLEGHPTTTYDIKGYLHAGYMGTTDKKSRSFIKFKYLPSLPAGAKITSAYLKLFMYRTDLNSTKITAHRVMSDWDEETTTWNSNVGYEAAKLHDAVTDNPESEWSFEITSLVQEWYNADWPNYGVMLKADNESDWVRSFYSSNASGVPLPKLEINYEIDGLGIEPFWAYDGVVNVHNGNLVLSDTDVTLPGRGVPINVTRTYNLRSEETGDVGYKWQLNVDMKLKYTNLKDIVLYISSDGTKMYFVKDPEGNYVSPVGIRLKLKTENNKFFLEEDSGIQYHFNSNGKLDFIKDGNENKTEMIYDQVSGKLSQIKDPSERYVNFEYLDGKLTRILGNDIVTVEYTYNGNNLTSVKKINSASAIVDKADYDYTTYNNLDSIMDNANNTTDIDYVDEGTLGVRVYSIKRDLTIDGVLQPLTRQYSYQKNTGDTIITVTDPKGKITKYTVNDMGNIASIVEDRDGLGLKTQFSWDEQQNLVEVINPKGEGESEENIKKYRTLFEYDEYGNLKRIEDGNSENAIFHYDENQLPIQLIDFMGRPNINIYDSDTRNMVENTNPLFSTNVIDRDEYGNVKLNTDPLGIGENFIFNSGFENWSGGVPLHWIKWSSGGTVSDDTTEKVNGNHSVKLVATGSLENEKVILLTDYFIDVNPSSKYNISWYVKTQNVGSNQGGATVDVHWYDENKTWLQVSSNVASTIGTQEFTRKGARVDTPSNAKYAKIALMVNDAGSAWFDNVQLEYGSVINKYNLLNNESFEVDIDEDGMPDGWEEGTLKISSGDGTDATTAHIGSRCILINGDDTNKYFYQELNIGGEAGVPLHFSGWSKSEGISVSSYYYQILLELIYEDDTSGFFGKNFENLTNIWEYQERIVVSPKNFKKIKIYGKLENHPGAKAWFDDFNLRLYGSPNALMSKYNIVQNSSFEYDIDSTNWPDDWPKYYDQNTPGTYDIAWIASNGVLNAYNGEKMIKISNVPSWAVVGNNILEPMKENATYTASAVIKTVNVTGDGAVLKFDIYDSADTYLGQKLSEKITETIDWKRVVVSITLDEAKLIHPNAAKLKVSVGTVAATNGDMYFDAVRMFEDNVKIKYGYGSKYNYVEDITNQSDNKTNLIPDKRGNTLQATDPENNIYTFEYDDLDRVKKIYSPSGLISEYYYDANHNLQKIENGSATGNINTSFIIAYNEVALPKVITDTKGKNTYYEYDKNLNLSDVKYPKGEQIHYEYDSANRISDITFSDSTPQWSFIYDKNSNLTQATKNSTQTTVYEYDNLNRLSKVTFPPINTISNYVSYIYNPSNQIMNITNSPLVSEPILYEYDQSGNNVGILAPNNIKVAFMYNEERMSKKAFIQGNNIHYITYKDYDDIGHITKLRSEDMLGNIIIDYSYEYDRNGNRIKEVNNLDNTRKEYSYDSMNEFTEEPYSINELTEERYYDSLDSSTPIKKILYKYDLLGNRTLKEVEGQYTTTYVYDDIDNSNEITKINGNLVYKHDDNGNLKDDLNLGWEYIYDAQNQLIQVNQNSTQVAVYEYNEDGLRTKKFANGKTENYYYNGDKISYISDQNNNLKYFFVRDTRGKLLNMIDYTDASPKNYWYLYDAHGNVVSLADENGNKVVTYEYDAWGNITSYTNLAYTGDGVPLWQANPFRYSSYQYDDETGFYYLKSRYYSADLGRFITRDKLMTINEYRYAGNNPVNFIDPEGMAEVIDAYGEIIQLSNGNIVDTKGYGRDKKYETLSWDEQIKSSIKNVTSSSAGDAVGKYTLGKVLKDTTRVILRNPNYGPAFELRGVRSNRGAMKIKGAAGFWGAYSVWSLGKTIKQDLYKYSYDPDTKWKVAIYDVSAFATGVLGATAVYGAIAATPIALLATPFAIGAAIFIDAAFTNQKYRKYGEGLTIY